MGFVGREFVNISRPLASNEQVRSTYYTWVLLTFCAIGCSGETGKSGGSAAAGGGSSGAGASTGSGGGGATASGGGAGVGGNAGNAGSGGSGATSSELCHDQVDNDGDKHIDCKDSDCFGDADCLLNDLGLLNIKGYMACGKPVAFTDADSIAACQEFAVSGGTMAPSSLCAKARFSGTLYFFCPPKPATGTATSVVVGWHVRAKIPYNAELLPPDYSWPAYLEVAGTRYDFLNTTSSGPDPLHKDQPYSVPGWNGGEQNFVGYHELHWPPNSLTTSWYTVWFVIRDTNLGPKEPFTTVAGGARVLIDMGKLHAGL